MKRIFWTILALVWALLTWHLTSTPQPVILEEFWLNNLLMMSAHFSFFGIQAVLLHLSFFSYAFYQSNYAIAITSFYGAIIEYHQFFIPGRTADPIDWLLDTLGAIAFLFLLKRLQLKYL